MARADLRSGDPLQSDLAKTHQVNRPMARRGSLAAPSLQTTMPTRYREWIQPDRFTEYQTTVESRGLLRADPAALLPPGVAASTRSESAAMQITLRIRATLTFCRLARSGGTDDLIALYAKRPSVHYSVDGKPHAQIIELLPHSLESQPLYASLGANQLLHQFWILPEETFSMGLLRRIACIFQMSLPLGATTHRGTEADTFGRYIALYQSQPDSKGLRLTKQRTRYIFTPQRNAARPDRPDITTRDSLVMRWEEWLRLVDADLTTQIHIRKQKVLEERIQLRAEAKRSDALPAAEKQRLLRLFDPEKRRAVSPWDTLESLKGE